MTWLMVAISVWLVVLWIAAELEDWRSSRRRRDRLREWDRRPW